MTAKKNDLTEVLTKLAQIEEHLRNMNGKLVSHDEHINNKCSVNRGDIYERIHNIDKATTRNTVIITAVQTIIVGVILAITSGWIH